MTWWVDVFSQTLLSQCWRNMNGILPGQHHMDCSASPWSLWLEIWWRAGKLLSLGRLWPRIQQDHLWTIFINLINTCHISGGVLLASFSCGRNLHRHLPLYVGRRHSPLCWQNGPPRHPAQGAHSHPTSFLAQDHHSIISDFGWGKANALLRSAKSLWKDPRKDDGGGVLLLLRWLIFVF